MGGEGGWTRPFLLLHRLCVKTVERGCQVDSIAVTLHVKIVAGLTREDDGLSCRLNLIGVIDEGLDLHHTGLRRCLKEIEIMTLG